MFVWLSVSVSASVLSESGSAPVSVSVSVFSPMRVKRETQQSARGFALKCQRHETANRALLKAR